MPACAQKPRLVSYSKQATLPKFLDEQPSELNR